MTETTYDLLLMVETTYDQETLWMNLLMIIYLGKLHPTKTDEFLEKFQTAFDPPPPPHFRKIMLQIF